MKGIRKLVHQVLNHVQLSFGIPKKYEGRTMGRSPLYVLTSEENRMIFRGWEDSLLFFYKDVKSSLLFYFICYAGVKRNSSLYIQLARFLGGQRHTCNTAPFNIHTTLVVWMKFFDFQRISRTPQCFKSFTAALNLKFQGYHTNLESAKHWILQKSKPPMPDSNVWM